MKLYIKLMSGDVLEYVPKMARGSRCKIETHKHYIKRLILDHLKLEEEKYVVNILSEEDEKEIEDIYYSSIIKNKSSYYIDDTTLFAFVQSKSDYEDSFFDSCESVLFKARELYSTIQEKNKEEYKKMFSEYIYQDVKKELERTIWQMSYCLGIPIIIGDCDPQVNNTKKLSKAPTRTVIYHTRALENCEKRIKEYIL